MDSVIHCSLTVERRLELFLFLGWDERNIFYDRNLNLIDFEGYELVSVLVLI